MRRSRAISSTTSSGKPLRWPARVSWTRLYRYSTFLAAPQRGCALNDVREVFQGLEPGNRGRRFVPGWRRGVEAAAHFSGQGFEFLAHAATAVEVEQHAPRLDAVRHCLIDVLSQRVGSATQAAKGQHDFGQGEYGVFIFVFRFDDLRFRLQQNIDFLGQGGDRKIRPFIATERAVQCGSRCRSRCAGGGYGDGRDGARSGRNAWGDFGPVTGKSQGRLVVARVTAPPPEVLSGTDSDPGADGGTEQQLQPLAGRRARAGHRLCIDAGAGRRRQHALCHLQPVLRLDGLGGQVDGLVHFFQFLRQQVQGGFQLENALFGFGQGGQAAGAGFAGARGFRSGAEQQAVFAASAGRARRYRLRTWFGCRFGRRRLGRAGLGIIGRRCQRLGFGLACRCATLPCRGAG